MPHTYKFADAARTTVVRDDGATFPWPVGDTTTPGAVGAALGGFVGEDYRTDGCPMPDAAGGATDKGAKGKAKLKLRARKAPKRKPLRASKAAKPVDADLHPRPQRKPARKPARKPKTPKKGRKHK